MAYILYVDTPCLHALIGDTVGSRCTVILGARHCFMSKVNTLPTFAVVVSETVTCGLGTFSRAGDRSLHRVGQSISLLTHPMLTVCRRVRLAENLHSRQWRSR